MSQNLVNSQCMGLQAFERYGIVGFIRCGISEQEARVKRGDFAFIREGLVGAGNLRF